MERWLEEKRQEPKVGQMLVLLRLGTVCVGVREVPRLGSAGHMCCRDTLRRENTQFPALTLILVYQINCYDAANPAVGDLRSLAYHVTDLKSDDKEDYGYSWSHFLSMAH